MLYSKEGFNVFENNCEYKEFLRPEEGGGGVDSQVFRALNFRPKSPQFKTLLQIIFQNSNSLISVNVM